MRLLLDTNLLISGIISSGLPRRLLDAARVGDVELCTSPHLLAELQRVLGRAKFAGRLAGLRPEEIVDDLRKLARVVDPVSVPRIVQTDPDDDHVLAAALSGAVDLIVSGDLRDLLPLGSHAGIPIVTARDAWERLGNPP